ASIFLASGILKLNNFDNALFLFELEHPVPFLSAFWAALLVTFAETVLAAMVALGLFARLSAIPLLCIAMVIQFVVGEAIPAFQNDIHYFWMLTAGLIIIRGPGAISVDYLLVKLYK
ncbi:MAG: DoxX family protein, partial [Pseudomonadota bacterium]